MRLPQPLVMKTSSALSHKAEWAKGHWRLQITTQTATESLNFEEIHIKQGFDEGHKDGLIAGKEEARQVGLKVGFEVGEELGFYKGCVEVWNSVIRVDLTRFSTRVQKGVKQMEELVERYPVMEPENESVQEIMEDLRLKFKAVCASLGVKLEYKGYPRASSSGAKDVAF